MIRQGSLTIEKRDLEETAAGMRTLSVKKVSVSVSVALGSLWLGFSSVAHANCPVLTGAEALTASGGVIGQLLYNPGQKVYAYCNGTSWKTVYKSKIADAPCEAPGQVSYMSSSNDLWFCDGSSWYSMKGASLGACGGSDVSGQAQYDTSVAKFKACANSQWYDLTAPSSYPVSSVRLAQTQSAVVGAVVQLQPTVVTVDGNVVTNRTVTYSSSDSTIASVNSSGQVTALKAGYTKITATAGGVNSPALGLLSYYLGNGPDMRIDGYTPYVVMDFNKNPMKLTSNETIQLFPKAYDDRGNPATITNFSGFGFTGCSLNTFSTSGVWSATVTLSSSIGVCTLNLNVESPAFPAPRTAHVYLVNISGTTPPAPQPTATPAAGYLAYRYVYPGQGCGSLTSNTTPGSVILGSGPVYTGMLSVCQNSYGVTSVPDPTSAYVLGCTNITPDADASFAFKCSGGSVTTNVPVSNPSSGYLSLGYTYGGRTCGSLASYNTPGNLNLGTSAIYQSMLTQCQSLYGSASTPNGASAYVLSCYNTPGGAHASFAYACQGGSAPTVTVPASVPPVATPQAPVAQRPQTTQPSGYLSYPYTFVGHSCGTLSNFTAPGSVSYGAGIAARAMIAQCQSLYGASSTLNTQTGYVLSCTNTSTAAVASFAYSCTGGSAPVAVAPNNTGPTFGYINDDNCDKAKIVIGGLSNDFSDPPPNDTPPPPCLPTVTTTASGGSSSSGGPGLPVVIPFYPNPGSPSYGPVDVGGSGSNPDSNGVDLSAVEALLNLPDITKLIVSIAEDLGASYKDVRDALLMAAKGLPLLKTWGQGTAFEFAGEVKVTYRVIKEGEFLRDIEITLSRTVNGLTTSRTLPTWFIGNMMLMMMIDPPCNVLPSQSKCAGGGII